MSTRRLVHLFKHAGLRLSELTEPGLEPYGIDGREFGVLSVLNTPEPLSQLEAAQRLRIDRTTMVAMVDALEGKGLVGRRPHPGDRRKNMVELTEHGRETLSAATRVMDEAEEAFLAPLPADDAQLLRDALSRLVPPSGG